MSDTINRYAKVFAHAASVKKPVFIPFFVIGDPSPERFIHIVDAAIEAGATALELGIPFSDPAADGPAIADSMYRALKQKVSKKIAFHLIKQIRSRHPDIPIGLLTYGNLVCTPSADAFYSACQDAGVDSVLVADIPVQHIEPYRDAAQRHQIDTVLIAPPNASASDMERIAQLCSGYVYLVSRVGVTGADRPADMPAEHVIRALAEYNAPSTILGFGISQPQQVHDALVHGANGVVCGSALANIITKNLDDDRALIEQLQQLIISLSQVEVSE